MLSLTSKLQMIVTKQLGSLPAYAHTHIHVHVYTYTHIPDIPSLVNLLFPISCFHRNPHLMRLQCSDSAVVPSFVVLTSCTQCSGRLPGCILIESTYTGLQCLLHRCSPHSPPCCFTAQPCGFDLRTRDSPITLETLLSCISKLTKCERPCESRNLPCLPLVLAFVSTLQVRD